MDGSPATAWSPAADRASLTVDLGRPVRVGTVRPAWTKRPLSYTVDVSTDRRTWHAADGTAARYVRIAVRGPGGALAELDVRS